MTIDIATIKASAFLPYVGESFQMVDDVDLNIPVRLTRCQENPKGEMPGAPRTPFSLEFEAETDIAPPFQWGDFVFRHPIAPTLGPVYTSRIMNSTSPNRALFQVVLG